MKVHRAPCPLIFLAVTAIALAAPSARADVVAIGPAAFPGAPQITFTGLPDGVDANGLLLGGVQFSYSLGFGQVTTGGGPATANNVSLPALVSQSNSAGILTLVLPGLQSMFGFGFALETFAPVLNAVTVTLFNGATNVGALSYNAVPDPIFAGGFAGIQSTLAFNRVQLTFNPSTNFAVDNIRFADVTTVTPEPATLALVLTGFVGVATFRRRRRFDSE